MQIEDGFRRHLASYRIDGFPLDDIMVSAWKFSHRRRMAVTSSVGFQRKRLPTSAQGFV
jgi:hypothetical protein